MKKKKNEKKNTRSIKSYMSVFLSSLSISTLISKISKIAYDMTQRFRKKYLFYFVASYLFFPCIVVVFAKFDVCHMRRALNTEQNPNNGQHWHKYIHKIVGKYHRKQQQHQIRLNSKLCFFLLLNPFQCMQHGFLSVFLFLSPFFFSN